MSFTKIWVFFRFNQHGQVKVCWDAAMLLQVIPHSPDIWALVLSIYRFIGPSKRTPVVLRTDLLLTGLFLVGVYMQVKLNSHWYVTIPNSNCLETFNRLDANRQCRLHFRPSCEDRIFCWNMFLWIQWGAKSLPGFVYIREFRFGSRTDQ